MSKHTPGPWEWYGPNLLCGGERQSENILNSADDGKSYGMHSALIEHHWDGDVAKANARLIAAAPDLLEASKEMLQLIDAICRVEGATVRKARAAIAKATGEPA